MSPIHSVEHYLASPGRFAVRTREMTPLKPDWVRLRFLYCGICGSDMSQFEHRREISYPASLGHEFVAEVVDVGAAVDTLQTGDVVTSDLNYRCGKCDQCSAQRSHLCDEGQIGLFTNRAFADVGDIHASYLLRLDRKSDKQLALSEPLSCVLHAKRWAKLRSHDRVLVIGAGGIGLCMAFAMCGENHPFEISEVLESRRRLIGEAIAPTGTPVAEPEGTYDVVFDVSGSESGLHAACTHVKPGGRLCTMSHLDGYTDAEFLLPTLTRRDVTFTVSYLNGEPENLATATRMLGEYWSCAWDRLLEVLPIDQLQEAFERRRTSPRCKTLIHVDHSVSDEQTGGNNESNHAA